MWIILRHAWTSQHIVTASNRCARSARISDLTFTYIFIFFFFRTLPYPRTWSTTDFPGPMGYAAGDARQPRFDSAMSSFYFYVHYPRRVLVLVFFFNSVKMTAETASRHIADEPQCLWTIISNPIGGWGPGIQPTALYKMRFLKKVLVLVFLLYFFCNILWDVRKTTHQKKWKS